MFMQFSVHVSISDFLIFAKNGFVVGVRSLKVTACHLNNAGCCYEYTIVSVPRIARRYTIQCSLPNTHTVHIELDGGRQAGREALKERGMMEDGRREQGRVGTREHEAGNREGERMGRMEGIGRERGREGGMERGWERGGRERGDGGRKRW